MTSQECTPKIKVGDWVWIPTYAVSVDDDGYVDVPDDEDGDTATYEPGQVIPHSPALPAVARWLQEHGGELRYGQHTPGDWLDVVEATFDEQDDAVDRLMLADSVMPALRALIAALTPEGV